MLVSVLFSMGSTFRHDPLWKKYIWYAIICQATILP
jgi:hypothetical protein